MRKIHPARVVWDDSTGSGGWHSSRDVHAAPPKPAPCVTVGYLLEDRKKFVTLAMSVSQHTNQVHHVLTIPRAAVVKVERLRL